VDLTIDEVDPQRYDRVLSPSSSSIKVESAPSSAKSGLSSVASEFPR